MNALLAKRVSCKRNTNFLYIKPGFLLSFGGGEVWLRDLVRFQMYLAWMSAYDVIEHYLDQDEVRSHRSKLRDMLSK